MLDDVKISQPKVWQALRESQELRSELFQCALKLSREYMTEAPRRTGRMASSVRPGLAWSTYNNTNVPIGTVSNDVKAPNGHGYAVYNLTGAGPGKHRRSTGKNPRFGPFQGDFTFNRIVKQMGGS